MQNTTLNQKKLTEEKNSIYNFEYTDQLSITKENSNSNNLTTTMNFWGRGAHSDELNFFQFDSF